MKYIVVSTMIDGTTSTRTVDYEYMRQVYDAVARMRLDSEMEFESIRVYHDLSSVDGLCRAALAIAHTVAKKTIDHGSCTATQIAIDTALRIACARVASAGEHATAEYIGEVVKSMNHDAQDFYGYAMEGLQATKGQPVAERYRAGYIRLNRHIHSQRAATAHELSTEFIIDGGGDIVSIGTAIGSILRGTDKYTPTPSARLDNASARKLCVTLAAAVNQLTPTQKDIVRLMGNGYSMRQIAVKLGRNEATIREHAANIRKRIAAYFAANAPEMVDNKAVQTSICKAETDSAAMANKSKSAEYYRAYRARKAAEHKKAECAQTNK